MGSIKTYLPKIFSFSGKKLVIVLTLIIAAALVIRESAIKAYSESETQSYRQQSIFNDSGLKAENTESIPAINPNPASNTDENKVQVISMSYEVDKITPTPTPVYDPSDDAVWLKVAECESHQNWKDDTGNGYYGGLQFSLGAWSSVGGSGKPSDASRDEQIMRGKLLQKVRGWAAWGACSRVVGVR